MLQASYDNRAKMVDFSGHLAKGTLVPKGKCSTGKDFLRCLQVGNLLSNVQSRVLFLAW